MKDLEFVQRCVSGEKQAWDEFVDRYSRLIYNYIYSVFKAAGTYEIATDKIDDLFQEIFFSLVKDNYKRLSSFQAKNGCSLASWLRQVVIHHTIDYLRRSKSLVSLDAENENGFSLQDVLADSRSFRSDIENKDKLTQLTDCIAGLDIEDKYFLELYLNRGLKLEELKELLGISRALVDVRKSRIIRRLKECFQEKGFLLDF